MVKKIMGVHGTNFNSEFSVATGDTVEEVMNSLLEDNDEIEFDDITFYIVEEVQVVKKTEYIVKV